MDMYRTLADFEYRSQNKRGGRPMVIKIPAGSIGEFRRGGTLAFVQLRRRGHVPFVYWNDVYQQVEKANHC